MAKKNSFLQTILDYLLTFFFNISVILFIVAICFDIFTENGKIGSFSVGSHHSKGYNLPVKVRISIPDSVVSYHGENFSSTMVYNDYTKNIYSKENNYDKIKRKNCKKYKTTNEILTCLNSDHTFKLHPEFTTNGNIIGKSSDKTIFIFQIAYNYLNIVLIILILYQLMMIIKHLSFNPKLIWRVKLLGIIILVQEIVKFVIIQFIDKYYYPIFINSYLNNIPLKNPINITINPSSNFNLTLFIVGISLLVLSKLLKQGYFLKQENELTI